MKRIFPAKILGYLLCLLLIGNSAQAQMVDWNVVNKSGCRPLGITFTNWSLGVDSLFWNMGDGVTFWTPGNIVDTTYIYTANGTYNASIWGMASGSWVGTNDTATIRVFGSSGSFVTSHDTACIADVIQIYTLDVSNSYNWDFGDGNTASGASVTHQYAALGTYTVSLYLDRIDCGLDTITQTIEIVNNLPPVVGSFSIEDTLVCIGTQVAFRKDNYAEYDTVVWFYGDGFQGAVYDTFNYHSYLSLGYKTVTLVVFSNCGLTDTAYGQVHVVSSLPADTPMHSATPLLACTSEPVEFTLSNVGAYDQITWYFDDGDTSMQMTEKTYHSYSANGVYNAYVVVQNGCGALDTGHVTVTVDASLQPIMGPFGIFPHVECKNTPIDFWLQDWEDFSQMVIRFGDGDSSTILKEYTSHQYPDTGVYHTMVKVWNDCGNWDTITKRVYIVDNLFPPAMTNFSTDKTVVCPGEEITFICNDYNSYASIVWHYGDGSRGTLTALQNFHAYDDTGVYNAYVVGYNECGVGDTGFLNVAVVDTIPLTLGAWSVQDVIECPGAPVNYLVSGHTQYTDFTWHFGDGDSGTAYSSLNTHKYADTGAYTVQLVAWNGCGFSDTGTTTVNVVDTIHPNIFFTAVIDTVVCPGDLVAYYLFGADDFTQIHWDFGDGNSDTNRVPWFNYHNYADTGDYNVTLVVHNECGNTDTGRYMVHAVDTLPAKPMVYSLWDTIGCIGDLFTFQFDNYSDYTDFTWFYGDGDSGTTYGQYNQHAFADTGVYQVALVAFNGCNNGDTSFATVYIVDTISADAQFVASATLFCKQNDTIYFTPLQQGYDTYYWQFGDGDTSHSMLGNHAYATGGTFTVTLIATNGCGNSDTATLDVSTFPEPVATFTDLCVCGTNTMQFTDATAGQIVKWSWDFGDGDTSNVQNPDHTYASPGSYTVMLRVVDNCGFSHTTSRSVTLDCYRPTANFGYSISGKDITVTDSSVNAVSWLWDMGDGGQFTQQNLTHTYGNDNIYKVCLTVTNYCGSKDTLCQDVLISGIEENEKFVPKLYAYPNPYREFTNIGYQLDKARDVRLAVYNLMGQTVAEIQNGEQPKGDYIYRFSAEELGYPPGMYLVHLILDGNMATKTVVEVE